MKFLSFLLCTILALSFNVNSFAAELESTLPESVPVTESEQNASSGDEYLDMILNNMQNDISDLESEVATLSDEVDTLAESNTVSDSTVEDSSSEEPEEINPELGIDESTPTAVNVYALNPITPEDTTGLKSVLLSLIGDYDAIVVEYEYTGSNNYTNYLREVQPDYVWLCSAGIFLVIIYSVFRLGGALFRG